MAVTVLFKCCFLVTNVAVLSLHNPIQVLCFLLSLRPSLRPFLMVISGTPVRQELD